MKYSVVIPVHNEKESVQPLLEELRPILESLDGAYEIFFIDDGSTDGTSEVLDQLDQKFPEVQCLRLRRRSGKSRGYSLGFSKASGEILITIDGDLQDTPTEIPALLTKLNEGFDLVVGMKFNRMETERTRKIPSIVFNYLLYLCFGLRLQDSNSGFRVLRKEVAETLALYGDQYRFIPQLAYVNGFRVTEQEVVHRKRKFGESKFGAARFYTGLCDLVAVRFVVSFHQKPLQFFGGVAAIPLVVGGALELWVLICKMMGDPFRLHIAALVSGIFLLLIAMQIFSLGLIGELLSAQRSRDVKRQ